MSKHTKQNIYLTIANNGQTLGVVSANYFVHIDNGNNFSVTLPDVSAMVGESLTFVTTNSSYESNFAISGPIDISDSSYSLTIPSSVTFLSDGTRWWVTNSNSF